MWQWNKLYGHCVSSKRHKQLKKEPFFPHRTLHRMKWHCTISTTPIHLHSCSVNMIILTSPILQVKNWDKLIRSFNLYSTFPGKIQPQTCPILFSDGSKIESHICNTNSLASMHNDWGGGGDSWVCNQVKMFLSIAKLSMTKSVRVAPKHTRGQTGYR